MKRLLNGFIIMCLFFCAGTLLAAPKVTVRVTGRWRVVLDNKNLLGAAGSNFGTPYDSAANEISMTIQNSATTWTLYVKRVDGAWNSNLPLYIQRTGPGSGGTVSGGDAFMEVTTTDQAFFTGSGTPSSIPLQLRLALDLANVNVAVYDTSLEYTLIED